MSSKHYYADAAWDEAAWIEAISVEYRQLSEVLSYAEVFTECSTDTPCRLLDVGCGSAIFPTHLSERLSADIRITCDLLDISERSLQQAMAALERLPQFDVNRTFTSAIEDLPTNLSGSGHAYDVIWAIHSLTTVDIERMPKVYQHLHAQLVQGGQLLIYQLSSESTYQRLHRAYRERHPNAPRYMESEDSERILAASGFEYAVHPLHFEHKLPDDRPDLLQSYLRKCVLDESLQALDFFADLLPAYRSDGAYLFPQSVNLLTAVKR